MYLIEDFLFPLRCPVCDRPVPYYRRAKGICPECVKKLPVITGIRCYKCGRKLTISDKELCEDCKKRNGMHLYVSGLPFCSYDDVMREMVYRMKYGGRKECALTMGRYMGKHLGAAMKRLGADALIPVPLHPAREHERGYNQAAELAFGISEVTGIPVYGDYISRIKSTPPLKSLTAPQRQNNLKKAFKIRRNDVKLRITIVIDDIYTTGSTIDAIAKVLMEAGTLCVYYVTLAIGEDI